MLSGVRSRRSLVQHAGQRGFRHAGGGEALVEEIALDARGGEHRVHPEGDAAHGVGEPHALQLVSHQPHPGALIGVGARGMERVLDRAAAIEREDERERARASAQLAERGGDAAGQPVDHEEEPLGIAEDVVGPLERGVGERWRRRAEQEPAIVGPREPPESDAIGAEAKLDRCLVQPGEIAAALDAGALEQVEEAILGGQHRDGEGGDPVAVGAGRNGGDRLRGRVGALAVRGPWSEASWAATGVAATPARGSVQPCARRIPSKVSASERAWRPRASAQMRGWSGVPSTRMRGARSSSAGARSARLLDAREERQTNIGGGCASGGESGQRNSTRR